MKLLIPRDEHGADRLLGWGISLQEIKDAIKFPNAKIRQAENKILVIKGTLRVVYIKRGEDIYKICTAFHK